MERDSPNTIVWDRLDPNAIDENGQTALMRAANGELAKVCKQLIDKMAPEAINNVNINKDSALMIAANNCLADVCKILIDKNLSVKELYFIIKSEY